MRTGIYIVEATDAETEETIRKVVIAQSADHAQQVAQFAGDALVGRLGDYDPGVMGARLAPKSVVMTETWPGEA